MPTVAVGALGLLLVGCHPPPKLTPDSPPADTHGTQESPPPDTHDTGTEVVAPSWPRLVINEVMAVNRHTLADGTGRFPPWIELYNPGDERVGLAGWTISGDHGQPDQHRLEQLAVEPGGFRVLWADDTPSLGPDHLEFGLGGDGGEIGLFAPDGTPIDGLSFGHQVADVAAARQVDGGTDWLLTASPTPGSSNGGQGSGAGSIWPVPPAPCGLVSDLVDPDLLEGDAVQVRPRCDGELGADAVFVPVGVPAGATWDGEVFGWQTDGASGGRIDLVFQITTRGATGELPSAEAVTFWVADDPSAPDNTPVDPVRYTEEWGLPVLHLDPEGSVTSSYVDAELVLDGVTYPALVKVRGASSSYYPKPGLTLAFEEAELDLPAWGVTRDHLVLVSPFDDNAYVRQKLVYDQWAAMAEFWGVQRLTPRSFFVVLYLDGVYHGLYMALDRVDDEFVEQQGFDRASSVYKAVSHDANFYLTSSSGGTKSSLAAGYEKKEGDPEDDTSDLEALVAFTGSADAQGLVDGAAGWLDLAEFMDWFLLVYYCLGEDSAGKNAYLVRAPDQAGFRYAPWDFNHAWGQDWRTYRKSSSSLNTFTGNNRVFWAIQSTEATHAELWERYRLMAQPGGPFDPDWILAQVDAYYALIDPSAQRDWDKWGASYTTYGGWASYRDSQGDWTDLQGEKAYLYQWLRERAELFAGLRE